MKFEEALAAMREGKKIRMLGWGPEGYIQFDSGGEIRDENGDLLSYMSLTSCTAAEWKIFTPPKLLWRRPVKWHYNVWAINQDWYPSKERFMKAHSHAAAVGPWESREEPEVEVDE